MARKYTSKDIRSLIATHKENLRQLEAAVTLPEKYASSVQNCVNKMLSAGTFARIVMDSLQDKEISDSVQSSDLIRALYLLKKTSQQAQSCQEILQKNRERILTAITDASSGANAVARFFSSAMQKQRSDLACESLEKEIQGGDYWRSSKELLSAIAQNDAITEKKIQKDFHFCVDEYKSNLKRNLPRHYKLSEPIGELQALVQKVDSITERLSKATGKTEPIKKDIREAVDSLAAASILDTLKTIPVEEINRDKNGFRVKTLRDAGYATIADIYSAFPHQLESVYGISEDAAYSIKRVANNIASEAKHNAKIKLSVDNKTREATNLVKELYKYRQYSAALDALRKLNADYADPIQSAIADLNSVGNGIFWIFWDDRRKKAIQKSFAFLNSAITGDYKNRVGDVVQMFKKTDTVVSGNAWDDFQSNSIAYFKILEEIVPGALGNDDHLYRLPEDLAKEIQEESFFPDGLKCELRRYQEWGVKYILHQERVLLGDEMGLGKTVQAIAAMVSLRNTGATHFVVVCPASVLPNWCKEITSKSTLRVTKVHGADKVPALQSWIHAGGVAVTTYETTDIFFYYSILKLDMLVVDEAHFIKNENAIRSINVRSLASYTDRILFMTGTALENKVSEMISLIEVLQPDVAKSLKNISYISSAPKFREKVAGVYYRRKREDVLTELPELIENREWCTMSGEEIQLYENEVLQKNFMGVRRLSWNVNQLEHSCKACKMMEIIKESEREGRKILICSFFLETIRTIHDYLGDRCCTPINGSLQPQRRQEIIDQFNKDPKKTVLCAQIQSGGTGLNIQAASVVIICEPQFKPSIENQAISRAYRMGQARNVLVYRLLCENTIDEHITEMLGEKQAIFNAFADKSVAAAQTGKAEKEVDNATFGKIIEEEIQRIKAKGGTKYARK